MSFHFWDDIMCEKKHITIQTPANLIVLKLGIAYALGTAAF